MLLALTMGPAGVLGVVLMVATGTRVLSRVVACLSIRRENYLLSTGCGSESASVWALSWWFLPVSSTCHAQGSPRIPKGIPS